MVAEAKSDADAATSGARGAAGNYTHGGDTEFARENADIGVEEAHSGAVHDQTRSWNANVKRTYDVHQTLDLDGLNAARNKGEVLFQLSTQALQNAIESANMISKQAIAHRDIAIDREWNIDEVAALVAKVLQTMQPTTAKT